MADNVTEWIDEELENYKGDKDDFLIRFSKRFSRSREYIKDHRYVIRKRKILTLWNEFYRERVDDGRMSKNIACNMIAREVGMILKTHKQVVKEVINNGN